VRLYRSRSFNWGWVSTQRQRGEGGIEAQCIIRMEEGLVPSLVWAKGGEFRPKASFYRHVSIMAGLELVPTL
jgi:hypothetical protein